MPNIRPCANQAFAIFAISCADPLFVPPKPEEPFLRMEPRLASLSVRQWKRPLSIWGLISGNPQIFFVNLLAQPDIDQGVFSAGNEWLTGL